MPGIFIQRWPLYFLSSYCSIIKLIYNSSKHCSITILQLASNLKHRTHLGNRQTTQQSKETHNRSNPKKWKIIQKHIQTCLVKFLLSILAIYFLPWYLSHWIWICISLLLRAFASLIAATILLLSFSPPSCFLTSLKIQPPFMNVNSPFIKHFIKHFWRFPPPLLTPLTLTILLQRNHHFFSNLSYA